MAVGTPTLVTPSVASAAASVTSAAFTPTASALLLAGATSRLGSIPGAINVSGGSLTWTQLAAGLADFGSGFRNRTAVFGAIAPVSPASMTVQATSTSAGKMCLSVVQVTGHGGLPGNSAAGIDFFGAPTVVLGSAPAAVSTVMVFCGFNGPNAITSPAGFIERDEILLTDLILHSCYDDASAPTSISYTSSNNQAVALAVEIAEASGSGLRRGAAGHGTNTCW